MSFLIDDDDIDDEHFKNPELAKLKIHRKIVSALKDQVTRMEIAGLFKEAVYKMKNGVDSI